MPLVRKLIGYVVQPIGDDPAEVSVNLRHQYWLDPGDVVYFEQADAIDVGGLALSECWVLLNTSGTPAEIPVWMEQSEIDKLLGWLER